MKYQCSEYWIKRTDNEKNIYLTKYECEKSEQGKNILLVHGLTFAQFVFDIKYKDYSFCEYFSEQGYCVWRLDVGGYGKSDKYENGWDVTTENVAKDIVCVAERICQYQNVSNIDVLGWSWGTMTTAMAARFRPELFRKMIWLGPCLGGMFEPVEVETPFLAIDENYVNRIWQQNPEFVENGINFNTVEVAVQNMWSVFAYTQKGGVLRPAGGAKEIMEAGDKWLIKAEEVSVPVLIVAGDHDFYTSLERCYQIAEQLPKGSRVCHLPGAGHAMGLEKEYYRPTREAVLSFLEEKDEQI